MHELEKFEKYTSYFHDGEILDIKHVGDKIEILMRSAEIDPDDIKDSIPLSKGNVLRGVLHIEGVDNIKINGDFFCGIMKMVLEDNDLLHLKIIKNTLFLEIGWRGSKPFQSDFSAFEIEAKKIWWENIPDLKNLSQ
jgi:hypothetical protein